jgi:hypothetical protein
VASNTTNVTRSATSQFRSSKRAFVVVAEVPISWRRDRRPLGLGVRTHALRSFLPGTWRRLCRCAWLPSGHRRVDLIVHFRAVSRSDRGDRPGPRPAGRTATRHQPRPAAGSPNDARGRRVNPGDLPDARRETATLYKAFSELALLRCRVVGTVGAFAVLSLDGEGKFGEGVRDPMPRIDVGGQFVMTTVEILEKGLITRAERRHFNPRIGRSRDFSRP